MSQLIDCNFVIFLYFVFFVGTLFWPVQQQKIGTFFWINSMKIILMMIIFPVWFFLYHSIIEQLYPVRKAQRNTRRENLHKNENEHKKVNNNNCSQYNLFMMMMMIIFVSFRFVHLIRSLSLLQCWSLAFNRLELELFSVLLFFSHGCCCSENKSIDVIFFCISS